jgi:hypothetical protein
VSILNKCYIYFRFSEINAWRQVSIQFQALTIWIHKFIIVFLGGGHDCDNILVGFTTICAISLNPVHGEVYSIQHYMIKFVSTFDRLEDFLGYSSVLNHDITDTLLKASLNTITQSKLILIPSSPFSVFIL